MKPDLASLQRVVGYGMANGHKSLIVDLDALVELFAQRADLLAACKDLLPLATSHVEHLNSLMVGSLYPSINAAILARAADAIAKAQLLDAADSKMNGGAS